MLWKSPGTPCVFSHLVLMVRKYTWWFVLSGWTGSSSGVGSVSCRHTRRHLRNCQKHEAANGKLVESSLHSVKECVCVCLCACLDKLPWWVSPGKESWRPYCLDELAKGNEILQTMLIWWVNPGKEILETISWHQWAEPNLTRTQREPLWRERVFPLPSLPSFLPSIMLCICVSV